MLESEVLQQRKRQALAFYSLTGRRVYLPILLTQIKALICNNIHAFYAGYNYVHTTICFGGLIYPQFKLRSRFSNDDSLFDDGVITYPFGNINACLVNLCQIEASEV